MNCPKCGALNQDNSTFCSNCGQPLAAQPQQPQQSQPQQFQQDIQQRVQNFSTADPKGWYNGHPMGWYKFLIYFALFASAAMYVISAITSLASMGSYDIFGLNLTFYKIWTVIYALALVALAVFCILTRNALAGLKADGPKFLFYLYCAAAGLSIINFIIEMISLADVIRLASYYLPGFTAGLIVGFIFSLAISVVMIILNKIYFDKRKDIFVR